TKEGSPMKARTRSLKRRGSWCGSSATISFLLVSLLLWPAQSAARSAHERPSDGQATTFSGRATVVRATVLGLQPISLSDTGDLDRTGGAKHESLLEAAVPGVLTAEVLHASTIGQGHRSHSEASVANLNLTVGGNTISAKF